MESVQVPDVPQGNQSAQPELDVQNNFSYIYVDDIVRSKVNNKIGVVTEVAGDYVFSSRRRHDPLPDDHVRVMWMDKSETKEKTNDVGAIDRSFVPGFCVASASDPTGQRGHIVDVNVHVDLLSHDGCTMKNVSSREIIPVREIASNDYVVVDSWLGRVKDVCYDVTVLFDDDSLRVVKEANKSSLIPAGEELLDDKDPFYFCGQRVRATCSTVKDLANSLPSPLERDRKKGTRANTMMGTVTEVTVRWVFINWLACGSDSSNTPVDEQHPKNLKLLVSPFTHSNWGLCDWCLHKCSISKSLPVSKETTHENWPLHPKRMPEIVIMRDKNPQRALLIMNVKTQVDVLWQDGTIEQGRESTSLIPAFTKMVPGAYVQKKVIDKDEISCEVRPGVVKSVNAKDQTACVRWIKHNQRAEDPWQFDKEKVVSLYELEGHPDYNYHVGHVVVRLPPRSMDSHMLSSANEDLKQLVDDNKLKQDEQLYHDHEEREDGPTDEIGFISDLACFGSITGIRDGSLEVTWADGKISMVDPSAIRVIEHPYDNQSDGSEEGDDLASYGAYAGSWRDYEDDETDTSQNDREDFNQRTDSPDEPFSPDSDGTVNSTNLLKEEQNTKLTDFLEVEETLPSTNSEKPHTSKFESRRYDFKGFDINNEPPLSHHFISKSEQIPQQWSRKVQQDLKILQNNLPDGIYVRVYEDRMDLVRVAIVGAYGTPYQDGLYVFDFHLPAAYPEVPPLAYYHSRGLRINPNLNEDGTVCLSLLNTWSGKGNEAWVPSSSNILQVVLSLQGIVLNSKPYFNEAGYDKEIGSAEGEKKSLAYNEEKFLSICQTMIYLMRDPPKDFENLVIEHFRKRGHYILKACDAYIEGHLIGTLTEDASIRCQDNSSSNTTGFKLALKGIVQRLIAALRQIGVDCEAFTDIGSV